MSMIERQVNEIMRLAGLLATARCQRLKANARNGGKTELELADARVQLATIALRDHVRLALSPLNEVAKTSPYHGDTPYDMGYDEALRKMRKLMEATCQGLSSEPSTPSPS